jgi:hypothetical protein
MAREYQKWRPISGTPVKSANGKSKTKENADRAQAVTYGSTSSRAFLLNKSFVASEKAVTRDSVSQSI